MEQRIFGLDLLRAIAILLVILAHGMYYLSPHFNVRPLLFFIPDGVSVFFVLSGFLIGQILIKRISGHGGGFQQLREFWVRRWFRTLPNYFLILLLVTILGWYYRDYHFKDALPFIVFMQNFAWPHPRMFPEAWSLSVEEWFYILFPLGSFMFFKNETALKKGFTWLIAAFIVFSLLMRQYRFEMLPIETFKDWDLYFRKQVVTRFDSLMIGVLAAYLITYTPNWWRANRSLKILIGLSLILLNQTATHFANEIFGGIHWYHAVPSFLVFAVGVFCFLPSLSDYKSSTRKVAKPITLISLVSYSMYLIHFTITQGFVIPLSLRGALAEPTLMLDLLRFSIYISFTVLSSILLYKYFEVPTTKLREKFSKGKEKVT